jgi:hypothetical protein
VRDAQAKLREQGRKLEDAAAQRRATEKAVAERDSLLTNLLEQLSVAITGKEAEEAEQVDRGGSPS